MTTSNHKHRLPEIDKMHGGSSVQHPSITIIKPTDTSMDSQKNSKPQFIVRKIDSQELFEDPIRNSNFMGLSQINEENTGDLDEVLPTNLSVEANGLKKEPSRNIFQAEMLSSSKYKEFSKGPLIQDGKIVRHTIVGTIDNFERFQRYSKKSSNADLFAHRDSFSTISVVKNLKSNSNLNSFAQDRPSTSMSDRLGSAGSLYNHMNKKFAPVSSEKKKNVKQDIKLTKDEVFSELNHIREREEISHKEELNKYKGKSLTDLLFLTKEERNLKKFENTNQKWHHVIENIDKKINRNAGESVMLAGEKHREKKEMLEAIDVIKTDEERFGSKLWMKTLRKYEEKGASKVTLLSLMSDGNEDKLSSIESERPPTSLEVIRKPRLIKTPAEVKRSSDILPTRTAKEYIDGKFERRGYMLEGIRPPKIEGMNDLVVEGKSKLKLEREVILKQTNSNEPVRVTKEFFLKKTAPRVEEVIEKNADNLEVIKHGLSALVK